MRETRTTRRRVVQGAGAIGVASLAGGTVVTAQEDDETGGGDGSAAFRVAHASPDAPNVDVRLDGGSDGGTGDDGGTDGDGAAGNETDGGDNGDGGDGAGAEIEGLGFREVSSYNEIEPGTYQAQVVVSEDEGFLGGILEEFFGEGDEEGETVVFDEEIEIQEGTTYTAVAFGELAQGPASTGDGTTGDESDGGLGDESDSGAGNETDGDLGEGSEDDATGDDSGADDDGLGEDGTGEQGAAGQGFQVEILEDDLTSPGENTSRFRVFHAVPDVDTVSIATADGGLGDGEGEGNESDGGLGEDGNESDGGLGDDEESGMGEDDGSDGGLGNETDNGTGNGDGATAGGALVDELAFGESETIELEPGDYTLEIRETGGAGTDGGLGDDEESGTGEDDGSDGGLGNETDDGAGEGTETDDGLGGDDSTAGGGEEQVREAQISPEGNATYSGFALGYFDPQAAGDGGAGGNESDSGIGGDNESDDGGLGNESGDGAGNETDGGEDGDGLAEDAGGEEFELVTVQDSQGGERSDGGTDGLLRVAPFQ